MNPDIETIAWRLGGPQGSGVNRIARCFARACAMNGAEVFCRREYHSNIMGRHSYNDVLIGQGPLTCHRESPDMMVTFEAEALCRHIETIPDDGCLIYSAEDADVDLNRLSYLDGPLRDMIVDRLRIDELPLTTDGLLEVARQCGVRTLAVPYKDLLSELAESLGLSRQKAVATTNTLAISVSASLLYIPQEVICRSMEETFPGQTAVVDMNLKAIALAYDYSEQHFSALRPAPVFTGTEGERLLVNATQSVALGKLAAGMGFQTYYPISPATDESTYLESHCTVPSIHGVAGGPLVIQVEDELSAVTMASGAALTGARSATSTSGPGFSLMAEGLGWAGMNEVPLVVTLYQRGGPSTGMPTRTDQGDLLSAIHAGHGEFPRIVMASADVASCFYDAAQAFDYAERYQLPVIHLLDKALTSTLQTVPVFDSSRLNIDRGECFKPGSEYPNGVPRFVLTESGVSPRTLLGQPGSQDWTTGVEHDTQGQVTEDPALREQMMEKRARKLVRAAEEIPLSEQFQVHGDKDATFTILTWGSNHGAVIDAMKQLSEDGILMRLVQLRLLWPFPAKALAAILSTTSPLVLVESNFSGQLDVLLKAQTGRGCDHLIVKYSGRPFSSEALIPVLRQIHAGQGEARMVLRNPYE